jgi:hypothetical protein
VRAVFFMAVLFGLDGASGVDYLPAFFDRMIRINEDACPEPSTAAPIFGSSGRGAFVPWSSKKMIRAPTAPARC